MMLQTDTTTFWREIKNLSKEISKLKDKWKNSGRRFKITDKQLLVIVSFLQKYQKIESYIDPVKDNVMYYDLYLSLFYLQGNLADVRSLLSKIRDAMEETYADVDIDDFIKFIPSYNIGELLFLDFAFPLKSENIKRELKSQLRKYLGDFAQRNLKPESNNECDQSSYYFIQNFNLKDLYDYIIKISYINECLQNQIRRKYYDKEQNVTLSFANLNKDYTDHYIPLKVCMYIYKHIKKYLINTGNDFTFCILLNGFKLNKAHKIQVNEGYHLLFGYLIHQLGDKFVEGRIKRSEWLSYVINQTSVNLDYIKKKVYEYTGRHTGRYDISADIRKKCDEIDNLISECIKHFNE